MGEYEQIIEESVCERTKEREWVYVREREREILYVWERMSVYERKREWDYICVRESECILIKVCTPIPYQTMLNKHIVI